ncbi:cytochrome [Pragia fontium]|uniref:Cytochrome n=1 Tax=Pragia fontium TaxID=82985 RepID=A0ABQ5LFQ5_9GAMM|nr:c-type cytochrome [Pragia fontium]GKX61797.1 cytochrome [Pragia fontium]
MTDLMRTLRVSLLLSGLLYSVSLSAQTTAGFYSQSCASCHGRNGEKTALNKSRVLSTLDEAQVIEALTVRRDGKIKGAGNKVKMRLSDDEIKHLAEYIQTLKVAK